MQTFSNPAMMLDDLPRHQNLELLQVMPGYKKILFIERTIFWLVLIIAFSIAVFYFHVTKNQWLIMGGYIILSMLLGVFLFTAGKAFDNMGYALRKHDLVFRKGWLFEKLHIIPLKKIQHCQVKRGPLERRYGLASLKIFTAGGAGADITLNGLTQQDAERLKDWLVISPGEPINSTPDEDAATMG
jgi:membrane protein YdbS with pleckstrin-like domain